MGKIYWATLALLLLGSASTSAVTLPKGAEASLLVTGTIEVGADGVMLNHTIDHPEKLAASVVGLIDRSLGDWHFKPMSAPRIATMRLVVLTTTDDAGKYGIWVDSATFDTPPAGKCWSSESLTPPNYPGDVLSEGVGGTAYVYVHVDRKGKVIDVGLAQVDLSSKGSQGNMNLWRRLLGNAAVDAAKTWRCRPPTRPDSTADADSEAARTFMVPVSYTVGTRTAEVYGEWKEYFPGLHHSAPWLPGTESSSMKNPEAMAANGIYPVQPTGLELLTQLATD
jgi:TonB family protein